jgi:hypothetical protein
MSNSSIALLAIFVIGYITSAHLWEKHSKNAKKARYHKGYNYGASSLLSREFTCDELLAQANNGFDQNEFDMGVKQAVCDYLYLAKRTESV